MSRRHACATESVVALEAYCHTHDDKCIGASGADPIGTAPWALRWGGCDTASVIMRV